jgi:DNA-binding CsgD family transcriptional regulator
MPEHTSVLDEESTVTLPPEWWGSVLRSVAVGDRRVVVEDAAGNRFVLLAESRFRALEAARQDAPVRSSVALTAREREVLQLVGDGCPGSVVAERLGLAANTVAQHLAAVRRKYGVNSSAAACVAARADGLID